MFSRPVVTLLNSLIIASSFAVALAHASSVNTKPSIQAASWLLMDGETGEVLAELNADEPRQPASLTKIMTAYVVLGAIRSGAIDWDEKVAMSSTCRTSPMTKPGCIWLQVIE